MFDKFFEILLTFIVDALPCYIVEYFEEGVRLRFGKKNSKWTKTWSVRVWRWSRTFTYTIPINMNPVLKPGFYFKLPFLDKIYTHVVKPTTMELEEQTITTSDKASVVAKVVIKYEVADIEKLLMEVNSAKDAIGDMVSGIVFDKINATVWETVDVPTLKTEISRAAKAEAKKWGLTILDVTLKDLGEMTSFRVFSNSLVKKDE